MLIAVLGMAIQVYEGVGDVDKAAAAKARRAELSETNAPKNR